MRTQYARPRRVKADLEPLEVKPRAVITGDPDDYRMLPLTSREPIFARPAVRHDPDVRDTLGDRLRDGAAAALERLQGAFAEIDGLLWQPEHPHASWAFYGCVLTLTLALTYCLVELVRIVSS